MRALADCGASLDQETSTGQTALLAAIRAHRTSTVRTLLVLGCDVIHRTARGETALSVALEEGSEAILQLLGRYGARLSG